MKYPTLVNAKSLLSNFIDEVEENRNSYGSISVKNYEQIVNKYANKILEESVKVREYKRKRRSK